MLAQIDQLPDQLPIEIKTKASDSNGPFEYVRKSPFYFNKTQL